jgi:NAD(P)-dependent dehydrogenase (short-subunit alcohol dehydrogenase family)
VARESDRLTRAADSLRRIANIPVHVISAALRHPAAPAQAIAQAVAQFGRLDLPVNNAGGVLLTEDKDWTDGYALKFHGHVKVTRAACLNPQETKGSIGNIVVIDSQARSADLTMGGSANVALRNLSEQMADIGIGQSVRVHASTQD